VLFWPDTFSNHFEPEVAIAAVEELEAAGFHVQVPRGRVCCGRPLYDYGFLGLARRYLRRTLAALREEIRAGIPVVGVEPSCVAVFRDELTKMLPDDEDARRLCKQTFHLAEFLVREPGYEPPQLAGRALLHGHCHGRATNGFEPEQTLLERAGLAVDTPESSCCGMAGAWGYERGHYDVSVACAERVLLPAVRDAAPQTLVVASGFSCRSQIEQLAGAKPLHIAQVLRLARGRAVPKDERAATSTVTAPSGRC
jgi:Fe-S oxidoreductase